MPKDDLHKLASQARKCIFLGYGRDGSFGYQLWDPENREVVRSVNVVFNESNMHTVVERPIKLRRVTFSNATPTYGPAMDTRVALRSAA